MKQDNRKEWLYEVWYLLESAVHFLAIFGRCLCGTVTRFGSFIKRFFVRYLSGLQTAAIRCKVSTGRLFKKLAAGIAGTFAMWGYAFGIFFEDIALVWRTHAAESKKEGILGVLQHLAGTKRQRKRLMVSALNYAMPVVALAVAVNIISGLVNTDYALAVTYNGVELGYIADESVYTDAAKDLQSRIVIPDDGIGVSVNAELTLRALSPDDEVVSSAELTDRMMQNANQDIVEAEGIYVDGKFIGAVEEVGAVEAYLSQKLENYLEENGYKTAVFTKDIRVEHGYYVEANMITYDDVIALFESETASNRYYTVEVGDTPIGIAAEMELSLAELVKWNPGVDERLIAGDEILVGVSEPYLSIEATMTDVYTTALSYKTVKEETASLYGGETKVKQEGKDGEQLVTAEVTLLNGFESERTIVSKEIVEAAVDEIVLVGTKKPDPVTVPSNVNTSGGKNNTGIWLSWPTSGGYVSSSYGARWGSFHRAIDIAKVGGCYGDRIFAAADGTVTYASYNGTFGKLIKISHGNGLETWYAHCSDYNVSVGDKVSRGQTIGYIGNTGRSTGPHLHFQVMVYGNHVNPLNYLK